MAKYNPRGNKTACRLLEQLTSFPHSKIIEQDKPRMIAAMNILQNAGLVKVHEEKNDFGHKWFVVTYITNKERGMCG